MRQRIAAWIGGREREREREREKYSRVPDGMVVKAT